MIVAIFGKSGVGKTHLASRASQETGWHYLAIDEFGSPGSDRWPKMLHALRQTKGIVLVESNIIPPQYRAILNATDHLVVEVTADEETRQRRMRARGRIHWSAKTATIRPHLRVKSGPTGVRTVIERVEETAALDEGGEHTHANLFRARDRGNYVKSDEVGQDEVWGGSSRSFDRHRAPSAEKNAYKMEGI